MPAQEWVRADAPQPRFTSLLSAGHSVIEGGNDTGGAQVANRMTTRLRNLLGISEAAPANVYDPGETNVGKGSAGLLIDDSTNSTTGVPAIPWSTSGGWVSIAKKLLLATQARTGLPILSPVQLAVLMHAYGDMAILGPTNFDAVARPVLRAVLRRLRAGAFYKADHASIVYAGGTNSQIAAANYSMGGIVRQFATANGTATITVPAWYPGGLPIDVGGTYTVGASNFKVEVTVNGARKAALDVDVAAFPDAVAGNNPEWLP